MFIPKKLFKTLSLSKLEFLTIEVFSDRDNFKSSSAQPVTNISKSQSTLQLKFQVSLLPVNAVASTLVSNSDT